MDIDNLQIQIQGEAKSASSTIDALCRKIDKLSVSLNQLDGSRIVAFASGVKALNNAAQGLNNIKTPDFTRLAKNLTAMNNLNLSNLSNISTNMNQLASSMNGLTGLSNSAQQVTEFTKSLSALGNKSATNAISNLPNLATAMNDFITKMSKVPKVSQNTIDLTNALARLARTGASSGRAANSLSTAFNGMNRSSRLAYGGITKLNVGIGSLRGLLGKLAPIIGMISLVDLGKQAIDTASQLTEVQNVVDTTFGNYSQMVEDMAKTSIQDYGMSELTTKKIASRFQAMGTAMGFPQKQMAGMSVELTKLAADMASFYDVSQNDVAKSLQSVFTGETEPVRQFGLDVTNATLKQWALNNGLNANISSMSQAEKAMLRYQYVMANTTAAQGDFAKTSGSWANQVRILAENFKALGSIVGNVLINAFKPVIQFLNKAVVAVTSAVETIANALGAIFGWTVEVSPGGQTLDDVSSGIGDVGTSADNAGNSMGGAAQKAKELKKALMGFDEIEKLPDPTSGSSGSGGSGGSGGGSGSTGGSSAGTAQIVKTDSIFEKYKSDIKSLEELGSWIGDSLSKAMESIDWESIYNKARNFGTGLANFLNGLISPRLFRNVGRTIANSLNTALEVLNSYGETFDWNNFGRSIGVGITSFFMNWKPKLAASTFNTWANGILDTMIKAMDTTDWEAIGRQIKTFLEDIKWKQILKKIGTLVWEAIKAAIDLEKSLFSGDSIEGKIVGVLLALKFTKLGYSFGMKIWQKIADSVAGKTLTKLYGSKIGKTIADTIEKETESKVEKTGFSGVAKKIWENLGKISPVAQKAAGGLGLGAFISALMVGAEKGQKFIDKLRGGNGQISDMGTALHTVVDDLNSIFGLSSKQYKELSDLIERYETDGKSAEETTQALYKKLGEFGISADQVADAVGRYGSSMGSTQEMYDLMSGSLDKYSQKVDENTRKVDFSGTSNAKAYKSISDAIKGTVDESEGLDGILFDLEQMQKKGVPASTAVNNLKEEFKQMGIPANKAEKYIEEIYKTLGEKYPVSTQKANTSIADFAKKLQELKKTGKIKAYVTATTNIKNLGKTLLDPITKLFKKNPFDVKTELKEKAKDIQKKLDKFNNLKIEPETKTKTKASELQNQLNSLKQGYTMTFPSKVANTAQDMQNQLKSKVSGFTLDVTSQAVFSKVKDALSDDQKTFWTKAEFNSRKDSLGDGNKTFNTKANFDSRKDSLGDGNKTFNTKANFDSRKDSLDRKQKTFGTIAEFTSRIDSIKDRVLDRITAKISSLTKARGLSIALTAVFNVLKSGLRLIFNKDGGVYKNGKWSPVQAFASGGLPNQGQLFVAREAGPELVGKAPGGGTMVMNNNQIVESVSDGVYRAVRAANAGNNNSQPIQVTVVLEGDAKGIFRIVQQENNRIVTSTGQPALLT